MGSYARFCAIGAICDPFLHSFVTRDLLDSLAAKILRRVLLLQRVCLLGRLTVSSWLDDARSLGRLGHFLRRAELLLCDRFLNAVERLIQTGVGIRRTAFLKTILIRLILRTLLLMLLWLLLLLHMLLVSGSDLFSRSFEDTGQSRCGD